MLALGCPKVNCQYESAGSLDRLVEVVMKNLPQDAEETTQDDVGENNTDHKQAAFKVQQL